MKSIHQKITTQVFQKSALLLASAVLLGGVIGPSMAAAAPKSHTVTFSQVNSGSYFNDDNHPGNGTGKSNGQGDDHGNGQGNGNGNGLGEGADNGHGHNGIGYGGGDKEAPSQSFPHFINLSDLLGKLFSGSHVILAFVGFK